MLAVIGLAVLAIIGYAVISFLSASSKDKVDLQGTTAARKFHTVIDALNVEIFRGMGNIKVLNQRDFNLVGPNQLLEFMYSAGSLIVLWHVMYRGKKVTLEKNISNAKNVSEHDQYLFAMDVIDAMNQKMLAIQQNG